MEVDVNAVSQECIRAILDDLDLVKRRINHIADDRGIESGPTYRRAISLFRSGAISEGAFMLYSELVTSVSFIERGSRLANGCDLIEIHRRTMKILRSLDRAEQKAQSTSAQ